MRIDEGGAAERPTKEEVDVLLHLVSKAKGIAAPVLSFEVGHVTASGANGPLIAGGPAKAYTRVFGLRSEKGRGLHGVGSNGNVVVGAVLTMVGEFTLDRAESQFPSTRAEPTVQVYRGQAYRLAFVVSIAHGPAVPEGVIASKAQAIEIIRPSLRCEYRPPEVQTDPVEILGTLQGKARMPLSRMPPDFRERGAKQWATGVTGTFGSFEPLRTTDPGEFPLNGLTLAFNFDFLDRVDD